ncbi:TPA: hypothetical protein PC505_003482 [Morganella morganii]|jgi:hypothetical protein|nr:hypothetical protein [Morganella morganii]HDF2365482.1 hypothetical protein [Morganella morganii]HDF2424044.1 hypothetical protein [Morganella morganii]
MKKNTTVSVRKEVTEADISVMSSDLNSNWCAAGKAGKGKTVSAAFLQQMHDLKASTVQIVMMNSNVRLNLKKGD